MQTYFGSKLSNQRTQYINPTISNIQFSQYMNQTLLTLLLFLSLSLCALNPQKLTTEEQLGQWTTRIQAKPQYSAIPSQYYLCGFDFLELKWAKWLWNCNCGKYRWYQGRLGYRCNWCENNFYNQSSGISTIFCHYNNWNDQITKNFTTASPNSRFWKGKVMCPIHSYATGFTGKYGAEHEEILGLHGLLLKCTTTDYKHSQNVQDNDLFPGTFMEAKYGAFISGIQVKYVPEGKLTGLAVYAQGMPIISEIQVEYEKDSGYDSYPINIGGQIVENCASMTSQKKVSLAKTYKTTCRWNLKNIQTRGYNMFRNISMPPPQFLNTQLANANKFYKETTSQFGFQTPITTNLTTDEQILVFIPSSTSIRISTIIQQQKGNIAFTANLTMLNMVTGAFITKYPIEGMWTGFTSSSVSTKVFQSKIQCVMETPDIGYDNNSRNNRNNNDGNNRGNGNRNNGNRNLRK